MPNAVWLGAAAQSSPSRRKSPERKNATRQKGNPVSAVQTPAPAGSTAPKNTAKKPRRGGTLYRGNEGMWSWVLHRITGVSIFFFLIVHVLDTSLVRVSPEAYNAAIHTYQTPIMGIGEVGLVAAICYHAFNGIRIILIDFLPGGAKYQKLMFWIVIGLCVVTMIGFTPRHLINVFSH
ncbi:succinate dehydrogenase, cytochrome b556 subunit [Pseudoclavibacter sp. RFBJ3]|nr:succinate dehydrogenase, cytochrome b556 subunit [Pseudoclavibacter sp. AY1H1]PPF74502.1 succinate dehydrogenase, cytochrome b556 subunit [Pseudoclavibacter sp. Z016]PPF82533.1 succinate dehydrogenase, cytochrome b556 subunit [Pseudoclavibacter sp. RFBJ5]PPF91427.1 succinate dehydrogenase, cytochrome b556 subunit [Pseudoclavibacter sp. RFBJ3]PPF96351.1 succinate dehydrogenase, cytochrome b556 subunit [Pseudoclavibacter sp. RFBH5]PPG04980.1 succinate dehydrogenase, cytochrome b556 subunit [P